MNSFKLVGIKSNEDFKSSILKIVTEANGVSADQVFLLDLLQKFVDSITTFSTKLKQIESHSNQFKDFAKLRNQFMFFTDNMKEFAKIFNKTSDKFEENKQTLETMISKENESKVEELKDKLSKFIADMDTNPDYKKLQERLTSSLAKLKNLKSEYLKNAERYGPIEPLIIASTKFNGSQNDHANLIQERNEAIAKLKEKFVEEIGEIFEETRNMFNKNTEVKIGFVRDLFTTLHDDLEDFGQVLGKKWRRAKSEFNLESDISEFSAKIAGGEASSENYMYENISGMNIDEVTETVLKQIEVVVLAADAISQDLETCHLDFLKSIPENPREFSDNRIKIQQLYVYIQSLKDCICAKDSLFKQNAKYTKILLEKCDMLKSKMMEVKAANADKFESEKKPVKVATKAPEIKSMPEFDKQFFSALEVSSSFVDYDADTNKGIVNISKLFEPIEQYLDASEPTRTRYMKVLEKTLACSVSWTNEMCAHLVEIMLRTVDDLRSFCLAIKISYENVESSSDSDNGNKEKKEFNLKNLDPKIYERFIGEEENKQGLAEAGGDENKETFFSFLISNFDEKMDEKKKVVKLRISLVPGAQKASHHLLIDEDEVKAFVKPKDKEKEQFTIPLNEYKLITISREKGNKVNYFRSITFNKKNTESHTVYMFGDQSKIDLFRDTIKSIFKNASERKSVSKVNLSMNVMVNSSTKKKKTDNHKLSMNWFFGSYFILDNRRIPVVNVYFDKPFVEKTLSIKNFAIKIKDLDHLIFEKYQLRDCFFSYTHSLSINESIKEQKKTIETMQDCNVFIGAWDVGKMTRTLSQKSFEKWISKKADICIVILFNAKQGEANLKSIMAAINNLHPDIPYSKLAFLTNGIITLFIVVKESIKQEVHSLCFPKKTNNNLIVSFSLKDNNYLLLVPVMNNYSQFFKLNPQYFIDFFEKASKQYEIINAFDQVFLIPYFEDTPPISGPAKECVMANDYKKFREIDPFLIALKESQEEEFKYLKFEKNMSIERSERFCSIRFLHKKVVQDSTDTTLMENKTSFDVDEGVTYPFYCLFHVSPRITCANYLCYDPFEEESITRYTFVFQSIEVVPSERSPIYKGKCGDLILLLIHYSAEAVFVTQEVAFDEENQRYLWKEFRSESYSIEEEDKKLDIGSFYTTSDDYLKQTPFRIVIASRTKGIMGYTTVSISEEALKPEGKVFESKVCLTGKMVGMMKGVLKIIERID